MLRSRKKLKYLKGLDGSLCCNFQGLNACLIAGHRPSQKVSRRWQRRGIRSAGREAGTSMASRWLLGGSRHCSVGAGASPRAPGSDGGIAASVCSGQPLKQTAPQAYLAAASLGRSRSRSRKRRSSSGEKDGRRSRSSCAAGTGRGRKSPRLRR